MAWGTHRRPAPGNWRTLSAKVMRDHAHVCHVCAHGDADQVDHLVNVARWQREQRPGNPHQLANLAPIHGERCPHCGGRCHKDKTQAEAARARYPLTRTRRPERHPGLIR